MKNNEPIDLVVTWVDGNDEAWKQERARYAIPLGDETENSNSKYRDHGLLKYFFRGVEEYMPWINKVFFVTWGHLPAFLDTDHPKLRIVRHEEYIPKEYLPTFNSNVIELNFHRIKDLSENFISFNDDMFIIDRLNPEHFFKKDLPCDTLSSRTMVNYVFGHLIYYSDFNNMGIINKHFYGDKHFTKWISPQYELKNNFSNAVNMFTKRYSAFENQHMPISHKKSVFYEIWDKEYDLLNQMCHRRFRSPYDFSHWLMRYWNLASGNFVPTNVSKLGFYTDLDNDIDDLIDIIENKKEKIFLLNDSNNENDEMFEQHMLLMHAAFEKIFPNKSSYEL